MALAKGHRRGVLERGWRAGGAGGKLDVPGNCGFDGGGEPDHFKYGRQPSRSADLEKLERPGVAEEAELSDVALLKRLRKSKDWLYRLCCALFEERGLVTESVSLPTLRLIDATMVKEPGKTGSQWRIHYSLQWPTLVCDYFKITAAEGKGNGESLRQFPLKPQDYVLVDRGYCHASGIHYAAGRKAYLAVRLNPDGILLQAPDGS